MTVKGMNKRNGEGWLPSPFFLACAVSRIFVAVFQERTGASGAGVAGVAGTAGAEGAEGAADVAGCCAGVFSAGCVVLDGWAALPAVCGAGAVAGGVAVPVAGVSVAGVSHWPPMAAIRPTLLVNWRLRISQRVFSAEIRLFSATSRSR